MVGARPIVGRLFVEAEGEPGAPRAVLISEGLWQRRFGGAADVVGRAVVMNGEPATIVGVVPTASSWSGIAASSGAGGDARRSPHQLSRPQPDVAGQAQARCGA